MIEDLDLKEFITRKEMQALINKELDRRALITSKKEDLEDDFEKTPKAQEKAIVIIKKDLETNQDYIKIRETTHLLDSFEPLNPPSGEHPRPPVSRLDSVADSLMDVRVENLKTKNKVRDLPNIREVREYTERQDKIRRNRFDLYLCYVIYFTMVFLSFVFAFYVWTPVVKGIIYGRPKSNVSRFVQYGGYNFKH